MGESSNHAKLPLSEISIRISRFDSRAVAPDSNASLIYVADISSSKTERNGEFLGTSYLFARNDPVSSWCAELFNRV